MAKVVRMLAAPASSQSKQHAHLLHVVRGSNKLHATALACPHLLLQLLADPQAYSPAAAAAAGTSDGGSVLFPASATDAAAGSTASAAAKTRWQRKTERHLAEAGLLEEAWAGAEAAAAAPAAAAEAGPAAAEAAGAAGAAEAAGAEQEAEPIDVPRLYEHFMFAMAHKGQFAGTVKVTVCARWGWAWIPCLGWVGLCTCTQMASSASSFVCSLPVAAPHALASPQQAVCPPPGLHALVYLPHAPLPAPAPQWWRQWHGTCGPEACRKPWAPPQPC